MPAARGDRAGRVEHGGGGESGRGDTSPNHRGPKAAQRSQVQRDEGENDAAQDRADIAPNAKPRHAAQQHAAPRAQLQRAHFLLRLVSLPKLRPGLEALEPRLFAQLEEERQESLPRWESRAAG